MATRPARLNAIFGESTRPFEFASYIAACAYAKCDPARRECLIAIATAAARFLLVGTEISARRG